MNQKVSDFKCSICSTAMRELNLSLFLNGRHQKDILNDVFEK
jgi:hypothetical protein